MSCQVFNKKDLLLYQFYDNFPFLSQLRDTLFVTVCITVVFKYNLAVAFAVAVEPLLEALLELIFQVDILEAADTAEFVHLDELPLYVKVPVTFTYHKLVPDEFL